MTKRVAGILTMLGVIVFSACQQGGQVEEEVKVSVAVQDVSLGNLTQTLSFQGDIEAEVSVKVFSKIPDRIEKYYIDAGDHVNQGDPVADVLATTIEQGVIQAQAALNAAKAQEANLKVEYERAERLMRENAMSQQQYDGIKTQYEAVAAQANQARAALESVKSQYKDTRVSSPISGIVGKRYYEAGDMANPALPLVDVVQMRRVKVVFNATEQDLGKLALNQQAKVRVRAYPNDVFVGRVLKISPVLDPVTRMADVEVLIDNSDYQLKPGMFAEIVITTGEIKDAIVIPRYAVIENTSLRTVDGEDEVVKNYLVFTVEDSIALQKELAVKYVNHKSIAVESGIDVGEKLVVSGQNNLRDSSLVVITEEE